MKITKNTTAGTAIAIMALFLAGCAGSAHPIGVVKYGDAELTCSDIADEIGRRQRESGKKRASRNVINYWPWWENLKHQGNVDVEVAALEDRISRLRKIARKKECDFL